MVQRSNIQIFRSDIQIFRYCTLTKFMLIPNLDKLTTQFDFDNAFWARRTSMISENHFSIGWYIKVTFSLNVCWRLMFAFVLFSRPTSGLFWRLYQWFSFTQFISIIICYIPILNIHEVEIWNFQRISHFHLRRIRYHCSTWPLDH